jgi:Tfp pilus assembly protein PilF
LANPPLPDRSSNAGVAIIEQAWGADRHNFCLINLGWTLCALGQPAAAKPLLERALITAERASGADSVDVAACLNHLGATLCAFGEPAAARPLLERALAITEHTYRPDHPFVCPSLNNLGAALCALGEPAAARPLLERALIITEHTYGPDHPDLAPCLNPSSNAHEPSPRRSTGPAIPHPSWCPMRPLSFGQNSSRTTELSRAPACSVIVGFVM